MSTWKFGLMVFEEFCALPPFLLCALQSVCSWAIAFYNKPVIYEWNVSLDSMSGSSKWIKPKEEGCHWNLQSIGSPYRHRWPRLGPSCGTESLTSEIWCCPLVDRVRTGWTTGYPAGVGTAATPTHSPWNWSQSSSHGNKTQPGKNRTLSSFGDSGMRTKEIMCKRSQFW